MMRREKHGFTLVELLMVVIIVGVLVTLAVPNYFRAVERSKGAKAKAALDAIRKAQLQYRALYDEYLEAGDSTALEPLSEVDLPIGSFTGDKDWNYSVTAVNDTSPQTFTITATRAAGGNMGGIISLDQDGVLDTGGVPEWK